MIAIVSYGLGNVQAFLNIYKRLNIEAFLARTPEDLEKADRIILPGVGAFDWAMQSLQNSGLRPTLDQMVLQRKVPVLGVCVGMQMMAKSSEEGREAGLGWIDAEVRRFRFPENDKNLMMPHMGWNDVQLRGESDLLQGLGEDPRFYFLHSYYFVPKHEEEVSFTTEYGSTFASGVCSQNCFGVQFHPEKSHGWGIRLLNNFAKA